MNGPAALRDCECWVFDLDNTLYPASSGLMAQVSARMTLFVADVLGVAAEEAFIEQKQLFKDHGTTLRGLMVKHAVDPHAFLDYVHSVDYDIVAPSPRLAQALAALPGRKLVFTNASTDHAERVLDRLGIAEAFDAIFDVAAAAWQPKPNPTAYETLVERHRVTPANAVMVEDIAPNLRPAAALGMTTVWLQHDEYRDYSWTRPEATADYIHHRTDDLLDWLEAVIEVSSQPAER